jgi:hypothetical protein
MFPETTRARNHFASAHNWLQPWQFVHDKRKCHNKLDNLSNRYLKFIP